MQVNRTILKNIFSLSSIQIANYVLPILTVPYIVRVIGPGKYGLINFAQAFVAYFTLLINYGFDFTATREIANHRLDMEKISRVFSSVIYCKMILFGISSIAFLLSIYLSDAVRKDIGLFFFTYIINIGFIFSPSWFFQGIEELSQFSYFNFASKIIFTVLIFLLVTNESDYYFVPLSGSLGQIFVGLGACVYAYRIKGIRIVKVAIAELVTTLKNSFSLFVSSLVINFYTLSTVLIIGYISTAENLGYYAAAYKIIMLVGSIVLMPISQTLFPYFGKFQNKNNENREWLFSLRKATFFIGAITLASAVVTILCAQMGVTILFGNKFHFAIVPLQVMAFIPFVTGLSNVFCIQVMLNIRMDKEFLYLTGGGALFSVCMNILVIPYWGIIGAAVTWFITETLISSVAYFLLSNKGIHIFNKEFFTNIPLYFSNKSYV